MDAKVDDYIQNFKSPYKEILTQLRTIIFKTFPDITEIYKFGIPTYGNKFYLMGFKDYIKFGFSTKGMTPEQIQMFEGQDGSMKYIKYHTLQDIKETELSFVFKLVAKNFKNL